MEHIKEPPGRDDVLTRFAELLGTKVVDHKVVIPEEYGRGYVAAYVLSRYVGMLINNHILYKDIAFKRPEDGVDRRMVFFKFKNIIAGPGLSADGHASKEPPSVQIFTSGLNPDIIVPGQIGCSYIHVMVDADYLKSCILSEETPATVRSVLENKQPLLFEQVVTPVIKKIADEIVSGIADKSLELYYYRIKAEEMVCRLLAELGKRGEEHVYPLNKDDVRAIYKVRDRLVEHLDQAPTNESLAEFAGMSLSKLKRIFKQVFGDSLFNYYQAARMQEAARLLRGNQLSVSAVGYQLGFSNLSHFSRVFEQHFGIKPKKFTMEAGE